MLCGEPQFWLCVRWHLPGTLRSNAKRFGWKMFREAHHACRGEPASVERVKKSVSAKADKRDGCTEISLPEGKETGGIGGDSWAGCFRRGRAVYDTRALKKFCPRKRFAVGQRCFLESAGDFQRQIVAVILCGDHRADPHSGPYGEIFEDDKGAW